MGIVGGFDVHRAQITFEYLDPEEGQVRRGQIRPATREDLRAWLTPFQAVPEVSFALEATTGWRFARTCRSTSSATSRRSSAG